MSKSISHYAYLKMSEHVYRGEVLQRDDPVPKATAWIIKEKRSGPSGFFAVVYEHSKEKQRIVAFRGTDSTGAVWEDVTGVVFNGNSPQKEAAFKMVDDVVKKAKEEGCTVSFTGHSLGAFLASLSVFYCHRYLDYRQASAVTFENPGPCEAMEKLKSTIPGPFDLSVLDITTYQSYPNRINTLGRQVGSLYTLSTSLDSWGNLPGFFLSRAHGTKPIIEYFEAHQNHPCLPLLTDWPVGNQRDVFFKESDFANGRYQLRTRDESVLDTIIGEKKSGECQVFLQQQTFNLEVLGHFQQKIKYNNQNSLALRHFSLIAQVFLKVFFSGLIDIAKHSEKIAILKENWKNLNLNDDIILCLLGYALIQETFYPPMVCLKDEAQNIEQFRNTLESWLADERNTNSINELLSLSVTDRDKRTRLIGMLVESNATTGKLKIKTLETIAAEIPESLLNADNPMQDVYALLDKVRDTFKEVVGMRIEKGAKTGDIEIDTLRTVGVGLTTRQYRTSDGSGKRNPEEQTGITDIKPEKKFPKL